MKNIKFIKELLQTGKVTISTNRLTLYVYDVYDGHGNQTYEVCETCDPDEGEEISAEKVSHPLYSGRNFRKALKELEKDINSYNTIKVGE